MSFGPDPTNPFREGEVFRVSGALSLQEAKQVSNLIISPLSRFILYALACGFCLTVVGAFRLPYPHGLILFAVLIASFIFMKFRLGRNASREGRGFYGVSDYEIDHQGIRVTTRVTETWVKWEAITKTTMTDQFILLFLSPYGSYIPIARSWFAKDAEWTRLVDFIRRHVPGPNVG